MRMVRKMTLNDALQDDLLQEALIHLWLKETTRPGQTKSWYFQSCKYHLWHYLSAGRSVDSAKRRASQLDISEESPAMDWILEDDSGESVVASVSARDIMALLSPRLQAQERAVLRCFSEGLRLREIGRKLKISHTMVIRHRSKIASLLRQLESPVVQPLTKPMAAIETDDRKPAANRGASLTSTRETSSQNRLSTAAL